MDRENTLKILGILQIVATSLYLGLRLRKTRAARNRRWWVHPINQRREEKGHFDNLFQELKQDEDLFFRYTRMNISKFNVLLELLRPKLTKTSRRKPIGPEQRLVITLRYLATGDNIFSIALAYRIGESTTRQIIKETCKAIIEVLKPIYLNVPTSLEWKKISEGFLEYWNLPNCLGAVDGKHCVIQAPPNSGSQFFNYKKTFSVVLMAVCDHQYRFTLIDVGSDGSQNDSGIFMDTWFGKDIYDKGEELNFPNDVNPLPGCEVETPYYFVGDAAFALHPHMMKPYPGHNLDEKKKIFNYRLSRGRRVIENSFGILSARWRVLRNSIGAEPAVVDNIIMACVCLHNYLRTVYPNYCPTGFADTEREDGTVIPGEWRNEPNRFFEELGNIAPHRSTQFAYRVRDTLASYFLTPPGEVPWQLDYIRQGINRFLTIIV